MYFRQVLRFVLILSFVAGCFPVVRSESLLELVPQEATKITLLRGIPAMEVDSTESTGRLQELLGRSNELGMKEDGVIFEVSNDSVFARFLLLQPNGAFEPDSIRSILELEDSDLEENDKGISYYKEDNYYVAWNAAMVLTGMVNPKYYYYEEENYYNDSYEDVDPESDKLSLERANELFDRIFVPDPSTSMKFLEEELEPVATSDIVYINTINERMYLRMDGEVIVVTNDRDILKEDFNGYKGDQSVSGELKDLISSRGMVIWGDITRLSEDEREAYTSCYVAKKPLSNLGMRNSDIFTGSVMYGGNLNDRVMGGRVVFDSTPSEAYYEFIKARIIQF